MQVNLREVYRQAKTWLCRQVGVNPNKVLDPVVIELSDIKAQGQCSAVEGIRLNRDLMARVTPGYLMSVMVHEVAHWLDYQANGWELTEKRYEWLAMTAECLYDHETSGCQSAMNLCIKDEKYCRPVTNFLSRGPEYARAYLAEKLAALQPIPELVG